MGRSSATSFRLVSTLNSSSIMSLRTALVLAAGLALALASPVSKQTSHEDGGVVIVPLESQVFMGDDETGLPGGYFSYNPFGNPFSGFLQSMDAMLRNLREQMSQVLHRLPAESGEWTEIPDGKGNTTSTTKVINGHKVTINETTYANHDDNSGSIFKIRIVDVHPTSDEDSESDEKPVVSDVKPADVEEITKKPEVHDKGSPEIEESANEIPQGKPEMENLVDDDIETLAEELPTDNVPDESIQSGLFQELMSDSEEGYVPPLPEIETNDVNIYPYNLANDVDINQMLADRGAPHDPDAELIEPIRNYDALSRDIYVNKNYRDSINLNAELVNQDKIAPSIHEWINDYPNTPFK